MPEHQETAASLWRRLAGGSYLWWALAVIIAAGTVPAARATVQGGRPADPLPAAKTT
jgi:alpha-1,2-mannosyltransferase